MFLETPAEMALSAAERFRSLRKRKKLSIKTLSEQSGVAYSTLRRFERSGEISFVALIKIASVLDCDDQINTLFSNTVPSSIGEILRENRR